MPDQTVPPSASEQPADQVRHASAHKITLPMVAGRPCVPVRLIPFLTRCMPLSPDQLAQIFSWNDSWRRRWHKGTYRLLPDGSHAKLQPRDWEGVSAALVSLEKSLRRKDRGDLWDWQSIKALPVGVFVWRDDLEGEYRRFFGGTEFFFAPHAGLDCAEDRPPPDDWLGNDDAFKAAVTHANARLTKRPGDGELTFDPLLNDAETALVFEGFEQVLATVAENKASAREPIPARQRRRLSMFRRRGCKMEPYGDGWRQCGIKGALQSLANEERAAGRPMSDKNDVKNDLIAALLAEGQATGDRRGG